MSQNYSNIVAGEDSCYKKLYEDARNQNREANAVIDEVEDFTEEYPDGITENGIYTLSRTKGLKIGVNVSELPDVTEADNGKVLKVVDGTWAAAEADALPTVTVDDAGKVLRVTSAGEWAAEELQNASGVYF